MDTIDFAAENNPVRLIINEENIVMYHNVTGEIFFQVGDDYFPEWAWNDFPVCILEMWVNTFISAIRYREDNFMFYFMDGPFHVELMQKENKMYTLYFMKRYIGDDKDVIMAADNISQMEIRDMLLKACRRALRVLTLARIPDSAMVRLRKMFEELKRCGI
ncbi:MAG: hypothetical protein NC092_13240 [Butyrivibrio sp.]|nr:hypothetical protein [Muribaculum sp.]MCM1553636.1 hypothetical protein [Butyrivibrio sp.]